MRLLIFIILCSVFIHCSRPKERGLDAAEVGVLEPITFPGDTGSHLPHLVKDLNQQVYLSWVTSTDDSSKMYFSKLTSGAFDDSQLITQGHDWFVNWADYPMISTHAGVDLIAFNLVMNGEGTYTYDIQSHISSDGGRNWKEPFVLHDDSIQAEHGFVAIAPYNENYFVSWLDGRNTAGGHHDGSGAMTLRGAILNKVGKKLNEWELDNRVCDCCQTAAVVTDNGPVVVYRDRSDLEIRDMYIIRMVGDEWTEPRAIYNDNWEIKGCPVNGPRMAAKGNNLAIAWFTASPEPSINFILSNDGGESFDVPIQLNDHKPIGRVDVDWIDGQRVFVIWMEGGNIVGAIVDNSGVAKRYEIANSSDSRSSGFPQLVVKDGVAIMAWTDVKDKTVKVQRLKL